jgi:ADP-ribose pyrophosphatase
MEEKIRTLGVLSANHFSVRLDTVKLRTGRMTERIKIEYPEAAAVIPFVSERRILMVRQWRYAIGQETLEIPAGKTDPGEDVEVCAHRELEEETGYKARRIIPVFSYYPAIAYSNERICIFAASGLELTSTQQDIDEISKVEEVDLDKVFDLMMEGRIKDGKTVIGLSFFRTRFDRGDIPKDFFQ